ncbi:DUF167 domain-containing protein [Tuwongella immobilis]|uniref:UPF0235 protein GMBLW1_19610 n=1 Tax=Tuwongella immobilis TaxID=692036 RepID=A0A6C2YL93_9BACT|nr:DUF167 domain-containing protein [Tuwongella immobilis]VIP01999.1 UPF0235 protein Sinac_5674 OS=Singulisphaera acidiphila (strain ATCC BAA-1392 / DSM 18658 / VKM B-2454 / MOB10) GN=Sinac_5674 PE=3 SV=1: DUF167 [Tuwongella immobilis]VTS00084.1 UPF0235 protein Sinac_5674 OS=Singulisphaera acidiphila (strain ATCC BAA-1392 / DSM 18658 / VKM B-2454 / MOB10) GN=Sinac_5674 PE=3 SV=1: DUF167 [Tuwongella immobilis]
MITATPHASGAILPVRAQPGARKNAVLGEHSGMLKVAVTAPPEDGRANAALQELLAEWLGVKRSQVELFQGATNRQKAFLIHGTSASALTEQIARKLAPPDA